MKSNKSCFSFTVVILNFSPSEFERQMNHRTDLAHSMTHCMSNSLERPNCAGTVTASNFGLFPFDAAGGSGSLKPTGSRPALRTMRGTISSIAYFPITIPAGSISRRTRRSSAVGGCVVSIFSEIRISIPLLARTSSSITPGCSASSFNCFVVSSKPYTPNCVITR